MFERGTRIGQVVSVGQRVRVEDAVEGEFLAQWQVRAELVALVDEGGLAVARTNSPAPTETLNGVSFRPTSTATASEFAACQKAQVAKSEAYFSGVPVYDELVANELSATIAELQAGLNEELPSEGAALEQKCPDLAADDDESAQSSWRHRRKRRCRFRTRPAFVTPLAQGLQG